MSYKDLYQQSIEQPEVFWRKQAELIKWYEFPETILSQDENGFFCWFAVENEISVPPTIDDPVILDDIRDVMRQRGIGLYTVS